MSCLCNNKINRNDEKIECTKCSVMYHAVCVKLKQNDIDYIQKNQLEWKCLKCTASAKKTGDNTSTKNMSSPSTSTATLTSKSITMEFIYEEIIKMRKENNEKHMDLLNRFSVIDTALERIHSLEKENEDLKKEVQHCTNEIKSMQQKNLINCVDVFGIPRSDNLPPVDGALQVFNSGIGLELSVADFDDCYYKGRGTGLICVKFKSQLTKKSVLKAVRLKKIRLNSKTLFGDDKESPIYINESLSPYTRQLFNAARDVKRNKNFDYLWITNGAIKMRKNKESQIINIQNLDDLTKI